MPELPSGTVTFLFTDIEHSTQSAEALGNERWADALQIHRDLLRPAFETHGGVEVGTEGDAFFVAFARAGDAVNAAIDAQRALGSHAWPGEFRVRVRMGVHTGEALVRGDDYIGHDVHKAKRVEDAGHGGQILLSQTTADLVRDHLPLKDLGPHRLKDLGEPQRLYQVVADGLDATFPSLRSLESFAHNLPQQRSTFVGREAEIAEVRRLLETNRLVTLTGVGGCGKTRLALQVGAELLDEYPDGVFFVDLAPVSDATAIVPGVAAALGITFSTDVGMGPSGTADSAVIASLAERRCLLIVDNCEHLLDGCAVITDRILDACQNVQILATSREALDVQGEQSWRVPSMTIASDVSGVDGSEAISLFKARAQAVRSDFELTPDNVEAVADICRRLDGIPLAIEFAASRVTHLSPSDIAERLSDMFRLLTGGRQRVQRQQTLEAALDWSYELLEDAERTLLRRLAVFSGTFTLSGVEGICADEADRSSSMDLLGSLVAKSLVVLVEGPTTRYRLIEPIRMYAAQKLREGDEADRYRGRHRDWYQEQFDAMDWDEVFFSFVGRDWSDELPNIRSALEWSAAGGRYDLAVRMATRAFIVWMLGGHLEEGVRWLTQVAPEELALPPEERAAALSVASTLAQTGLDPRAAEFGERAVNAAGETPSIPLMRALSWRGIGRAVVAEWTRDAKIAADARRDAEESVRLSESYQPVFQMTSFATLGNVEFILRDMHAAKVAYERSREVVPDGVTHPAFGVFGLATAQHILGEHASAVATAERFLKDENDSRRNRPATVWTMTWRVPIVAVFAGAGLVERATELLRAAADRARRPGAPGATEQLILGAAIVAFASGDIARASRLLGWVRSRTLDAGRIVPSPFSYALYAHYVRLVREALPEDEARQCLAEGRAMSEDEAMTSAFEPSGDAPAIH